MKLLLNLVFIFSLNCFATGFINSSIEVEQITTPSNPTSGKNKLYFKADNELYMLNSSGVETAVSGGGDFLADGSVPMAGNLDLGANDIVGVQDISFNDGVDAVDILLQDSTGPNSSRLYIGGDFRVDGFAHVTVGMEVEGDLFHSDPTGNVGFYGAGPVAQSAAIADASGGAIVDSEARAAINALLAYLRTRGDITP